MKVVCINNDATYKWQNPLPLTIGKVYHHQKNFMTFEELYYTVIDDNGEQHNIDKGKFQTLQEWRQNQLNKLGI